MVIRTFLSIFHSTGYKLVIILAFIYFRAEIDHPINKNIFTLNFRLQITLIHLYANKSILFFLLHYFEINVWFLHVIQSL